MDSQDPQVSICLFSYNYELYLKQAIESVLEQETNFPFEIIIGDDCSTDRTREIAAEYQVKYPDIIRLSFNEQNLGGTKNWINTMNRAKGRYIALLDGDDYFIDRKKLQKQYNILENNKSLNLVFSSAKEVYECKNKVDQDVVFSKDEYYTADILKQGWFMRTSTLFFRNGILPATPPAWVYQFPYRYDTILIVLLSLNSKVINCKDIMTAWRRHDAGLSYALTREYLNNYQTEKELYDHLQSVTGFKFKPEINLYLKRLRTVVVFNSLKSFRFSNFKKLGWRNSLGIDYRFLFKHSFAVIMGKLKLR